VDVPLQSAIIRFHLGLTFQNLNFFDKADHAFSESYQTFKNLGVRYWCSVIDQHHKKVTEENKDHPKEVNPGPVSNLTDRQLEILGYLTTGLSNKEIAASTYLSTRTVDMHVRNIFDRLNCRTRTEAAKIALDTGLVKTHTSKSER
jgi:DNA-binding NarL/FixJ family response regulator